MRLFLVLTFSLVAPYLAPAQPFLIQNGQPFAEIVVAEQPGRAAEFGATELQAYLEKITGCRLEIVTSPTDKPNQIYVGESAAAARLGVTAEGLKRDAFRMVSGDNWLALVGDDTEFEPIEPWARHHSQWANEKQGEWEELAGHPWMNPIGAHLYRDYSKQLDIWAFDHRGSLNAVYAFLRDLGVRWYMPGPLGEILPGTRTDLALPDVDRTVDPVFEIRSISRPRISSNELDDTLWYLRIGANKEYALLHHGQRHLTEHPEQRRTHPEYYAQLANGTRDTQTQTANACLSSEGFFEETVAFARLMFDHYDVKAVSVMPHDGFQHCQADSCRDQIDLERGPGGYSSDYVWDFVVRVANEVAKTHPDRYIFCGAYSTYREPPLKIEKLPDNVLVQITNGRPIRELDDALHRETEDLRRRWQEKTDNPLSLTLNYTPFTNRGAFRPQYWPHVIDRGIKAVAGEVWREDVWISSGKGGLHFPGMSHLNPYVISRLWWDADQDVDTLLEEYYSLFYGLAAESMQAFIEFCEREYARLGMDAVLTKEALALFDQVKAAAPPDSVFAQRLALVDEFLPTLRSRAEQIAVQRPEGRPNYRIIDMGKEKWVKASSTFELDGKVEEEFWTCYPYPRPLRDLHSGAKPGEGTRFMVRWWNDSLYLGIRCEFDPAHPPVIGTEKDGDPAIWQGEHLELLIETDKHSYYQMVVNPAAALVDLDRAVTMKNGRAYEWSSQAEVAAHIGRDHWSVEIRLPVTSSDEDPLHQIIGTRPFQAKARDLASGKGTNLYWYFNLFRKRSGTETEETTAFSPLGPDADSFHEPIQFADLYVQ